MGRVVAEVIRVHRTVATEERPARIEEYLTNLKVASTYWPGDRELRDAVISERAYQRYPRSRLRMFLEAVEDQLRAAHRVGRSPGGDTGRTPAAAEVAEKLAC